MLPWVIAVLAATGVILAVLLVSLVRQVRDLASSVGELRKTLTPTLDTLRREGDRARERVEGLRERRR